MKVIFIHGIRQERKDPVALKKEWLDALVYGLARADATLQPLVEFELPFYGDELVSCVEKIESGMPDNLAARGQQTDQIMGVMERELISELAGAAGLSTRDIAQEMEALRPRDPQNWGWVLATTRALAKIPGLDSLVISAFTRDVSAYISYSAVQHRINSIVDAAIDGGPFLVVSHSLGTVVGYNVLRRRAENNCLGILTLGSPLGISAIRRRLSPPLTYPKGTGPWLNAFDKSDIVALAPLDGKTFDIRPEIRNFNGVKNFTDNRHGIAGYLADPTVARWIAERLH